MMQLRHVGIALTIAALSSFLPAGVEAGPSALAPGSRSAATGNTTAGSPAAALCLPLDRSEAALLEAASLRLSAEDLEAARGTVRESEDSIDWDAALVILLVGALIIAVIVIQP